MKVFLFTHTHTHTHTHKHIHTHIHTHTQTHRHTHARTHARMHVRPSARTHARTHAAKSPVLVLMSTSWNFTTYAIAPQRMNVNSLVRIADGCKKIAIEMCLVSKCSGEEAEEHIQNPPQNASGKKSYGVFSRWPP